MLKDADAISPKKITGKPITMHKLNILVPIIFPIANAVSFFLTAIIVITNSGKEVPQRDYGHCNTFLAYSNGFSKT